MHLQFDNINNAFEGIVRGIWHGTIKTVTTTSRVGDVLQVTEPVIVTYNNPRERVLFNPARDANPFFHLFESLWMLAGRNDVAPLAFYSSKIKDIASDDGLTFNGAYGYRWRHAPDWRWKGADGKTEVDQLQVLIEHLRSKPDSRRAVLQMWNVDDDLLKIDVTKDVCCNTSVHFLIRKEMKSELDGRRFSVKEEARKAALELHGDRQHVRYSTDLRKWYVFNPKVEHRYLDMTVFNRSNDAILGMLGANVVHFSFLQEYVANCLKISVGKYHQVTNNLHVYKDSFKPAEWMSAHSCVEPYGYKVVEPGPLLVNDQSVFDYECKEFVRNHHNSGQHAYTDPGYSEPFLRDVAWPMMMAFLANKQKRREVALKEWVPRIAASDWRMAAQEWIERRIETAARKEDKRDPVKR